MRVHFLSIFASEPVGGGGRVRYGGGTAPGRPGNSGRDSGVLSGSEGNGMVPVAVMAGAGWLFLFVVLLIVPPSPGPHEGGGQGEGRAARRGRTRTPDPGDVPPAVVSLLARRLDRSGFGATMSAFREEVDAETRRLGLTRSRLSGRRIGLLLLLLFVP